MRFCRQYVLTLFKDMLIHFNAICLHISVKSRKFAVEKERETNQLLTLKPKSYEVQCKMYVLHFTDVQHLSEQKKEPNA